MTSRTNLLLAGVALWAVCGHAALADVPKAQIRGDVDAELRRQLEQAVGEVDAAPANRFEARRRARIVRARVVNPKWISGIMRHGYKGGFELAATVDYLFAVAATADCVADHHFDAVFDAYLVDDEVRAFLERHNPAALKDIADRLLEAQTRGLWQAKSNSAGMQLHAWAKGSEAA